MKSGTLEIPPLSSVLDECLEARPVLREEKDDQV